MTNPRVLLVEDDNFMLSLLTSIFESNGYNVAGVNHYSSAIQSAENFNPDVIILDIHLDNGHTGYNIADELKTHPKLASTPTVFLTGEKGDEFRCKAFICGGIDFLRKPFDKQDLLSRVKPLALIGRMMKTLSKINNKE